MKNTRTLLIVLSLLLNGVFSGIHAQEDSIAIYFNNSSSAAINRGKDLLASYDVKDSLLFTEIASKIIKKENKVEFYHSLGLRFYADDDYEVARIYFNKALDFAKLTLDKRLIAMQLEEVGDMHRMQDQNTLALNYLFQAMYLYKEIGDRQKIAHSMAVIGDVNRCLQQYNDALKYTSEALAMSDKDPAEQSFCHSSMGATYQEMKNFKKAGEHFYKGLSIATRLNDTMRIIDFEFSIGELKVDENRIPEALRYLDHAILLCNLIDDEYNKAFCYIGRGKAFLKLKQFDKALQAGQTAYDIGIRLKTSGFNNEAAAVLYQAYAGKGDYKSAFRYLEIVKENTDSTMSTEKIKQQAQIEINFKNAYEEKQDSLIRFNEQARKDLEYSSELQRQKIVAVAGIGGLLIAIIISALVFRSYKKEKHSREIINKQKLIVDAKNKEVLDSINYARKIQQAIIPTRRELQEQFPESFVMLLPKDIVSGDFYWLTRSGQQVFFAVADCTGHGVPGGFMSMLGTALLNEIITEKRIHEPADILDMLKMKIILALRQSDNTNENKDGMDISIFRLDLNLMELTVAGANNSLYLLRGTELSEFKGNKFPIGFAGSHNVAQFSQKKIQLQKGDLLYMFTDGYPDQFGGPQGKKFKYKPLEDLLLQVKDKPMDEQRKILIKAHEDWKGSLEQVDDICIAGIRI